MSKSSSNANQNTLGFRFAVIASLVLSLVSFLTTWSGLRAADPVQSRLAEGESLEGIGLWQGIESLVITLGLSFGIQALMLALAWIASRLIMVEQKKRWVLISSIFLGYLAATSISVTFSYIDLFDRMFSTQKSDWSAETIRERGDVIVEELIEELEEDLRSVRSEFSSQQATFQSQINLLTDASAAQRREILAKLDERREQLSTYQAEIGAARAEARRAAVGRDTRVGQLEESISDFADEVARLTAERDEVTEEVNVLEAQSRAKADQKLLEERGARESGESGRGPRWRELDREHDIIKANLEVVQNRLDRIEQELQNASDALLSGRQQLAVVRDAGDAEAVDEALDANNDVRVKFLRDEIADLRAQADALNFPQLDFTDGRVTEDDINKIERACTQIKSELITAQANDDLGTSPASQFDPGAIDCTSGGAFETARQFSSLQDSLTLIRDECRAQSSEVYESVQGGELLQYVRNNCINESALPAKDKAIFLADLRRVARTRDPDAAPIAYAFVALQDREPQAIFSLTLALAADLLILIVSLFGNAGKHVPAPAAATLAPAPRREQLPEPEPEPQPDDKPRDPFDNLFKNS